jgi:hypothetical protein
MSNKRYRLLKDMPYVKAGAIYELDVPDGTYCCDNATAEFKEGVKWDALGIGAVENNPEWFEEEHKCKYCGAWTSQPDEECYKAPQPKEDKPEWEIVAYEFRPISTVIRKDSAYWYSAASGHPDYNIHSVKRNSDGMVFSVGDETEYGVIKSFITDGKFMTAHFTNECGATLRTLKKSKPKEELKEPERWEITSFGIMEGHRGGESYKFFSPKHIPSAKWEEIRLAIEQVLNDGKSKSYFFGSQNRIEPPNFYTQEQVNKMMEDAFNAAREQDFNNIKWEQISERVKGWDSRKYPTFQDYKNKLSIP